MQTKGHRNLQNVYKKLFYTDQGSAICLSGQQVTIPSMLILQAIVSNNMCCQYSPETCESHFT